MTHPGDPGNMNTVERAPDNPRMASSHTRLSCSSHWARRDVVELMVVAKVDARAQLDAPQLRRRDNVAVVLREGGDHADLGLEEHRRREQGGLIAPRPAVLRHLRNVAPPIAHAYKVLEERPLPDLAVVHWALAILLEPRDRLLAELEGRPARDPREGELVRQGVELAVVVAGDI